jgi:hypothetical protein
VLLLLDETEIVLLTTGADRDTGCKATTSVLVVQPGNRDKQASGVRIKRKIVFRIN